MSLKTGLWPLEDVVLSKGQNGGAPFHVFLDEPTMSAELYELAAGHVDTQKPHKWDELYYVISGKSKFISDDKHHEVKAGDTIFVAANIEHRFYDITEDLKILVVFSKAEPAS